MEVLLICQAGMSTAIMCRKIEAEAVKAGESLTISAAGLDSVADSSQGKDMVLLAPQVKYAAKEIRQDVPKEIPIMIIPSQDFGMMQGDQVYKKMMAVFRRGNE